MRRCLPLLLILLPAVATAQVQPDTLPRLSPQEVEIRGELRVSFPSITRSPLSGFAAGPRLKEVPEDRVPFLPPYRQTDLPPSPLSRPTPPPLRILVAGEPRRGVLEAGAGSEFTRFGRFYLDAPASRVTSLYGSAYYEGSDGHRPLDSSVRAPYDQASGQIGVRSGGRRLSVDGNVGGFYRSYTLYGAEPTGADFRAEPQPDREGFGGHAALTVGLHPRDETRISVGLDYRAAAYDTGTRGPLREISSNDEIDETRVSGELALAQRLGLNSVEARFRGGSAGLDGGGTPGTEQTYGDASVAYVVQAPLLRVRLGASLLATRAKRTTGTLSATYVAPDVSAQLQVAPGVEAYVQNVPYVAPNAVATLFEEAPYLAPRPEVRPTAIPYNAEGGVRVASGDVQLRAWAGYQQAKRLRFFVEAPGSGFEPGAFVTTDYKEGRIFSAGGEARLLRVEGLHASLGGQYRNSELVETIEPIPYVPAAEGWLAAGYVLPGGRLVVEAKGTVEGVRYADLDATVRVPAYVDLDASASYALTPSITVVGRLDNLIPGNRTWWRGYPEASFRAMAGLSIRW